MISIGFSGNAKDPVATKANARPAKEFKNCFFISSP
jgi:hypothetical protein